MTSRNGRQTGFPKAKSDHVFGRQRPISARAFSGIGVGAERSLRRALELDPDALYPLWACALVLQMHGKHEESVAMLEKAVTLTERAQTWYLGLLGGSYGAAGRRTDALRILQELLDRSTREYVAPFHVAFVHLGLNDDEAAIGALELAVEQRNALAWWPKAAPHYHRLRANPRFANVLRKIVPG